MAGELKAEISRQVVRMLGEDISKLDSTFNTNLFFDYALDNNWANRELKNRIATVATGLGLSFQLPYIESLEIMYQLGDRYTGMKGLIFPEYVSQYGVKDWTESMHALAVFTSWCSSEFAVRAFIRENEKKMMRQLETWAESPNFHLRRLASEGCRPRLPWATPLRRYIHDPSPILPLLEKLVEDKEDYVYRSVANCLNDISKDHPQLALQLGEKWYERSEKASWVVKHGLRTLLKKGNTQAMRLFGFADPSAIEVSDLQIGNGHVSIGDSVDASIRLDIKNSAPQKVRVEYAVGYLKANGSYSEKVFKVGEYNLRKGEYSKKKRLSFKQMTTRKHYPGEHYLVAIINGHRKKQIAFVVEQQS